ncbi:unnamed protein product, partial [Amoebophrya sp. A120]
ANLGDHQRSAKVAKCEQKWWCELQGQFPIASNYLFAWLQEVLSRIEPMEHPEFLFGLSFLHVLQACRNLSGKATTFSDIVDELHAMAFERRGHTVKASFTDWFGFTSPFFFADKRNQIQNEQKVDVSKVSAFTWTEETTKLIAYDPFLIRLFLFYTPWPEFFTAADFHRVPVWLAFDCLVMKWRVYRKAKNFVQLDWNDPPDMETILRKSASWIREILSSSNSVRCGEQNSAEDDMMMLR